MINKYIPLESVLDIFSILLPGNLPDVHVSVGNQCMVAVGDFQPPLFLHRTNRTGVCMHTYKGSANFIVNTCTDLTYINKSYPSFGTTSLIHWSTNLFLNR